MARVDTSQAPSYPNIKRPKSRRIRILQLTRVDSASTRAPNAASMNIVPFPFGDSRPARHGHHPVFPVGAERRVGAWHRSVGLGVPANKNKNL